jgi:SAM-dependent methyltransferase
MQLYVGGLPEDVTEADIEKVFAGVGPLRLVEIIRDIESGKSKGFAIVKIDSDAERDKAVNSLNGKNLNGSSLLVRRMPETLPGEMEFREWLRERAHEVLVHIGVSVAETVLDYGSGPGIFTIPCARIVGPRGKVYAFEIRPGLLEQVEEKAKDAALGNIVPVLSDSSKLAVDLPEGTIDVVLVWDVMHAIKDRPGLLRELRRVLKDDGILSVFPMHIGTDRFMNIVRTSGGFCLRDRYGPPGFKGASEVLNFNKCQ